jgi:predicted house-cleaning noncanonical NTP pyrophosphatase (MazG superfamily)
MKYNKLIRDKIPEIIIQNGDTAITHIADDVEYWNKLKEKTAEFFQAENQSELADIMEVLKAIIAFKNFDAAEIEKIRQEKAEKRGGFNKKIILDES